jgi:hypothetical protein
MRSSKLAASFILGGASFWAPTVAIELITGRELSPLVGTVLPSATLLAAYLVAGLPGRPLRGKWTSLVMLAGVYTMGPAMMTIGWTRLGGSTQIDIAHLIVASLLPIFTLYMAGPDVTLFGVLLATAALITIHVGTERRSSR